MEVRREDELRENAAGDRANVKKREDHVHCAMEQLANWTCRSPAVRAEEAVESAQVLNRHALHVLCAARVDAAVDELRAERLVRPVLAAHRRHVEVSVQYERPDCRRASGKRQNKDGPRVAVESELIHSLTLEPNLCGHSEQERLHRCVIRILECYCTNAEVFPEELDRSVVCIHYF